MLRTLLLSLSLATLVIGCNKTEGGECGPELSEERQWYFLSQSSPSGNLEQCVICNFSTPPGEIADWIRDNAGNEFLSGGPDLTDALPCIYVYGPGPYDSESACQAIGCSTNPETNDAVYQDQYAGRAILEKRGE